MGDEDVWIRKVKFQVCELCETKQGWSIEANASERMCKLHNNGLCPEWLWLLKYCFICFFAHSRSYTSSWSSVHDSLVTLVTAFLLHTDTERQKKVQDTVAALAS